MPDLNAKDVVREAIDDKPVPQDEVLELKPNEEREEVVSKVARKEDALDSQEEIKEEEDSNVVNPHARLRILKNERDNANRDNEILARRMEAMLQKMTELAAQSQQPQQQQNQVNWDELDPIQRLEAQIAMLANAQATNAQLTQQQKAEAQTAALLQKADLQIQGVMQSTPDYKDAILHLAQVIQEQVEDDYPNLTKAEQDRISNDAIIRQKLTWVSQGKDPGVELYKRAVRMGYRPQESSNKEEKKQTVGVKKTQEPDAKEEINKVKQKQNTMASIGGTPSSSTSSKLPTKRMAEMSESEWNKYVDEQTKAGAFKLGIGKRNPSIGQLLRPNSTR